jgi:hypothetical protein
MIGYDAAFGSMFLLSVLIVPLVLLMRPSRTRRPVLELHVE